MSRMKNWWRGAVDHDEQKEARNPFANAPVLDQPQRKKGHDHSEQTAVREKVQRTTTVTPDGIEHTSLYAAEAIRQEWDKPLQQRPEAPREAPPAPSPYKQRGHADKGDLEDLTDQTKQGRDQLENIFDDDDRQPEPAIAPGVARGPRYRR